MDKQKDTPGWMGYSPMLQMYKQSQTAQNNLEPDMEFLSGPHLGRYEKYKLDGLELPESIFNFLNQTGLPDRFTTWRSPDEENDYKKQECYSGIIFSLRCLRIEKIKKRKFLVVGEDWSLGRCSIITDGIWTWWKTEDYTYIVVELNTGKVWQWIHYPDEDFLVYINSSLEQYLLSMAYWRAFYPVFAQKVKQFTEKNPEKTELDYIFKHRKTLYAPFLERIKALDPEAMKKKHSYWKCMCDISLV